MNIKLTAREFVNPWHKAMPEIYEVLLVTESENTDALLDTCNRLEAKREWHNSRQSAQSETVGDRDMGDTVEIRYLVHKNQYQQFKDDLKTAKR